MYVYVYKWVKNLTSIVACEPWFGFKEEIGRGAPICSVWFTCEILIALPYNPKEIIVIIDATEIHKKVSSE